MKKYLIIINGKRKGPFSKDEVLKEEIDSDTLIWFEGIVEWQKIKDTSDFIDTTIPPAIQPKIRTAKNVFQQKIVVLIKRFLVSVVISIAAALILSLVNYQICLSSLDCEMQNIDNWVKETRDKTKNYDESILAVGGLVGHGEALEYFQCSQYNKFVTDEIIATPSYRPQIGFSNVFPMVTREQREKFYLDLSTQLFLILGFTFILLSIVFSILVSIIKWMKKYSV